MTKGFIVLTGAGIALMLSSSPASACGCTNHEEAAAPAQSTPVASVTVAPEATSAPVNPTAYVTPEPTRQRFLTSVYNPTGYHSRVRAYNNR